MCRVSGRNDVPMWVTSRHWRPEAWADSLGCQCRWDGSKKRKRSTFILLWLILGGESKKPTFFLLLRYETPGVGQALSHSDLEAVNITIKTENKKYESTITWWLNGILGSERETWGILLLFMDKNKHCRKQMCFLCSPHLYATPSFRKLVIAMEQLY